MGDATDDVEEARHRRAIERNFRVVDEARGDRARPRRDGLPQVALAWLLGVEGVTAPIVGPRTLEQLEDLLGRSTSRRGRRARWRAAPAVCPQRMLAEQAASTARAAELTLRSGRWDERLRRDRALARPAGGERRGAGARRDRADRAREPGCSYQVHRDPSDPRVFSIYERYVDAAAYDAHLESEAMQRLGFGDAIPRLEERTRELLEPWEPS